MPSPNDNVQVRDALDAIYKLRTKDVSSAQDGSIQTVRHLSSLYPIDYGTGGSYRAIVGSGTMAAGLAASAPICGFRWTSSTLLALVRRVNLTMWSLGTGFTAGLAAFTLTPARSWTVDDTGGALATLTTSNAKLRTSMGTTAATIRSSTTATLTAGTRTLDATAQGLIQLAISTATNTVFATRLDVFSPTIGGHPQTLAQNEGLILGATVPATGTWSFTAEIEWDEVPLVNF